DRQMIAAIARRRLVGQWAMGWRRGPARPQTAPSRPKTVRGMGLLGVGVVIGCGFQFQESVYLLPSLPVYDRFSIELASIDRPKAATVPAPQVPPLQAGRVRKQFP